MSARNEHCCLCGERRRITQAPLESLSLNEIVRIEGNRPLQEGRWEVSPQMLVNVCIWRNGGTAPGQTHICDGCITLGLQHVKRFVDGALASLPGGEAA